MCYSAQVRQDYRKYVRLWGADISIQEYHRLYWQRGEGSKVRIPKAMDAAFTDPKSEQERAIKILIDTFNAQEATRLEQELFKQRKRLADAERILATKATNAAAESQRIATSKVERALGKLSDFVGRSWRSVMHASSPAGMRRSW